MSIPAEYVLPRYQPREGRTRQFTTIGLIALVVLGGLIGLGTFLDQEATTIALLVASMLLVVVCARPDIGILLFLANYLFASYPTPIRGGGLLTINNVLGVILSVSMLAELSQRPDFWFLETSQVRLLAAIGVVMLLGTFVSYWNFPDLRITWERCGRSIRPLSCRAISSRASRSSSCRRNSSPPSATSNW